MKLTALFVMLMAALALFAGAGDAAPQPKFNVKGLKSAVKTAVKVGKGVGTLITANEVYQSFKNRNNKQ